MQELIKALIKAKVEFNPIQKDGTNPHYKRKYATLDAVLDARVSASQTLLTRWFWGSTKAQKSSKLLH